MLTRVTEMDPSFANAWGLLAQSYAQMGSHFDLDPKWFELGEQAIARTLELDPVQCEALCARGVILWSPSRNFNNRAALRALNAASKIDPMRPVALHMRCAVLWHLGIIDASLEDAEHYRLLNPALPQPFAHLAQIALQQGHASQAVEFNLRGLALDQNQVLIHLNLPVSLLWADRFTEAREVLNKARQMFPSESFITGVEAIFAAVDGNHAKAEALADEASQVGKSLTHTHHNWHYCAGAYALIGKREKALAELHRCAGLGLPNYRLFLADPYLRSLHGNPEFQNLMTELRRQHDSIQTEFGLVGSAAN